MNKKQLGYQIKIAMQKRLKSEPTYGKPLTADNWEFLIKWGIIIGGVIYLINFLN